MLTYEEIIAVRLDGKIVGSIKEVHEGYQYFPKGSMHGGEIFATANAVKLSLED